MKIDNVEQARVVDFSVELSVVDSCESIIWLLPVVRVVR